METLYTYVLILLLCACFCFALYKDHKKYKGEQFKIYAYAFLNFLFVAFVTGCTKVLILFGSR